MTTRFFTSWVRRGAAAGITEVDPTAGSYSGPATFQPTVTLSKNGVAQPTLAGPEITLLGPDAVIGIDARLVVRTDPAPGATGVEDNFLVFAELARADLPWLFTPASPNSAGWLRPWVVLVVVDASRIQLQPGKVLPSITVSDEELPDLNDSWAWAHSQVTVDDGEDAVAAAAVLVPPSGGCAVSRLICPLHLQPDTAYLACLVPSTQVGVQAGLGLTVDSGPSLDLAWTAGSGQSVTLPVYYSWTFSTGANGDFKSLVQRLTGVSPDTIAGFGTRTVDMSAVWESAPQLGDGMTIELDGALGIDGVDRPGTLTDDARAAFETRLTALLNFPASLQPTNPANDPTLSAVAPPIYAGRQAGQITIPAQDGWLRTLNLDPRRRIAASFATRFVQEHQEFLMARAWDQLGAALDANKLRAQAELASEVADRLHARHLQTLGPSELISVAAPARTRVVVGQSGTLQATVAVTGTPSGAGTVAFTRMTRPAGPLGRRAYNGTPSAMIEKGMANSLGAAQPASALDGLGTSMASGPAAAQVTADATGKMFNVGWQGVLTIEKTLPPVAPDVSQILVAISAAGTRPPGFNVPTVPTVFVPVIHTPVAVDSSSLPATLLTELLPSARIIKRANGRITVPQNLGPANTTDPVMACPHFTAPLALSVLQEHPEYLLPGLGNFPDDRITLMTPNNLFVESFLAGANHEMNREMLWRGYPTDQRGTPFQYFWPRTDGQPDILPITQWPLTNPLGSNGPTGGPDIVNMVVLLVRGEVMRRFPRLIVYAAQGVLANGTITISDPGPSQVASTWLAPQFLSRLDSSTAVFGYAIGRADVQSDITNDKPGYYFVFSEPVTGPRFNFDEPQATPPTQWTDFDWSRVPTVRGFAIAGTDVTTPPGETSPDSPRWNRDAADMARIAFARPYRVCYHADELLKGVSNV
jgi:hypothetical protein